jgi:hypothetical protein
MAVGSAGKLDILLVLATDQSGGIEPVTKHGGIVVLVL